MTIRDFIKFVEAHASKLPEGLDTQLRYVQTDNGYARNTIETKYLDTNVNPFDFIPREDNGKFDMERPAVELIIFEKGVYDE